MLAELLKRIGEPWSERHLADFGLESADYAADFYNNGGLEIRDERDVNNAIQYVALVDGKVEIGAWAWCDDEDFDRDATFEVYEEDDFSAGELERIAKRIKEIYG